MNLDGALHEDPFEWFAESFARAARSESFEPARAALATVEVARGPTRGDHRVRSVDGRGVGLLTQQGRGQARAPAQPP
ncbi:MAG: hypothetical protein ACHQ53_19385, partial [Polyangiales bacterium]